MWDKRKLLLSAIIFIALCYKVTPQREKLLDMAPDAVDNLYTGCRKEALEKFIHSELLRQELNNSKGFQKAWSTKSSCSKLIPGGRKEHTTALLTYVNGDVDFIKTFNDAVETLGGNVSTYEDHFHFKSLHFLLTDSMTLSYPKKCKTFYALLEERYTAKKGSEVRFGRFTVVYSSYIALKKLADWEEQVVFNITSCFYANLRDYTCSDEDTALLSPAEVFTVEEVRGIDDGESEYTEIVLNHSKLDSKHNCQIFSRSPADVSSQWLVLMLVALSLFCFNC